MKVRETLFLFSKLLCARILGVNESVTLKVVAAYMLTWFLLCNWSFSSFCHSPVDFPAHSRTYALTLVHSCAFLCTFSRSFPNTSTHAHTLPHVLMYSYRWRNDKNSFSISRKNVKMDRVRNIGQHDGSFFLVLVSSQILSESSNHDETLTNKLSRNKKD